MRLPPLCWQFGRGASSTGSDPPLPSKAGRSRSVIRLWWNGSASVRSQENVLRVGSNTNVMHHQHCRCLCAWALVVSVATQNKRAHLKDKTLSLPMCCPYSLVAHPILSGEE
jgi:hypothetical protein